MSAGLLVIVLRLCGYAVMRLCGYAVMRLCGYAVMRLCCFSVMQLNVFFDSLLTTHYFLANCQLPFCQLLFANCQLPFCQLLFATASHQSFKRSGLSFMVLSTDCSCLHLSISAAFPERRTSGTFNPIKSDGLV